MCDGIPPDGERYLPAFTGTIRLEHYHRYYVAASLSADRDVLDIASGEGFGSAILARNARSVLGVDVSEIAVRHATRTYAGERLRFEVGNATAIPLNDASVDLAVSFETIEHLAEHDRMMAELRRVLRPGGVLLLSSPNKTEYSDKPVYENPFHVRELYTEELLALVGRHFPFVRHYGQRVTAASVIANGDTPAMFSNYRHHESRSGVADAVYDIVLASDAALPELENSIFEELDSPLQPRAVEAKSREQDRLASIQTEIEALQIAVAGEPSRVQQLEDSLQKLSHTAQDQKETIARLRMALRSVVQDANVLAQDKWWRRTKPLRRFSNSIRKLRGKPKKQWPADFSEATYLNDARLPQFRPGRIAPAGRDPVSGVEYPSSIEAVEFSNVAEGFVPFREAEPLETHPRAIAFYLPQFHPFPENDRWWGKGFTEWTNVGRARPLFNGHHQPHCPIHLGYYDLRLPEVMEEQARLARAYGVNGFAYYFYWFAGKVLMDYPLERMLANPGVDIPFCFIWANENWTRRWDGLESEVLIGQNHSLEDSRALLRHLRKFFDDPRYIRIGGKPLFVVYRPDIIPDLAETLRMWVEEAKAMGFPGLYLVSSQTFGHRDPRDFGFDAAMEFPPHTAESGDVRRSVDGLDPAFEGNIHDYDSVVGNAVTRPSDEYKVYPTVMLSWDNTARKGSRSNVFTNFSVTRYSQWLSANVEKVVKDSRFAADEKLVFINAWNEWAEGTHLEPDQKHGFGYLEATRAVMSNYTLDARPYLDPKPTARRSEVALIVHLHFTEVWSELAEAIRALGARPLDIYATATSLAAAEAIAADFPEAVVELVDNRGRDIRPFLRMYRKLAPLGYAVIGKVHGKKSSYRPDGADLRAAAYRALLAGEAIDRIMSDPRIGLLAPAASLVRHSEKNMTYSRELTLSIAESIGVSFVPGQFPAGSMFWFRPEALAPLLEIPENEFDIERGLVDGTRAHAIERLFGTVCESRGYTVDGT